MKELKIRLFVPQYPYAAVVVLRSETEAIDQWLRKHTDWGGLYEIEDYYGPLEDGDVIFVDSESRPKIIHRESFPKDWKIVESEELDPEPEESDSTPEEPEPEPDPEPEFAYRVVTPMVYEMWTATKTNQSHIRDWFESHNPDRLFGAWLQSEYNSAKMTEGLTLARRDDSWYLLSPDETKDMNLLINLHS